MPVDVNDMNIDLLSISGHKIYGPKGQSCTYVAVCKPEHIVHNISLSPEVPAKSNSAYVIFRPLETICVIGVGALYVRRRPRVRLEPLQSGGGQERGLRSGTVPTPLAVGLGAACQIAQEEMKVCTAVAT